MFLWLIITAASIIIDFVTKQLVASNMQIGDRAVILRGVLELEYVRNEGAAWGILSNHRWIFMVLSAIAILALPYFIYRYGKIHFMFGFSLSLILGGAIGNMIDRIFYGSVIDFIYLPFLDVIFKNGGFPRFNIADCCVTVGAILLFIYLAFVDKTFFREKEKTASAGDNNNEKT